MSHDSDLFTVTDQRFSLASVFSAPKRRRLLSKRCSRVPEDCGISKRPNLFYTRCYNVKKQLKASGPLTRAHSLP